MVRDEEKYMQALQFRKRGFTYSEIAKIVGVSVSTVSAWVSKKRFSKRIAKENAQKAARDNSKRMSLLNKSRKAERTVLYTEAIRSAETEYKHYKNSPLFIAGLMLYMADGDQTDLSRIRMSSTNATQHRIFIKFAKEFLGVPSCDIDFWLALYPNMKETAVKKWWTGKIGLSASQFGKTQYLPEKKTGKTLHHGAGNTIIGSIVLKKKLIRWIELASKEL
ncbi:MAG: putative transcriptional regulator [Candidatus Azotimanducaceae bacterium]|jgi:predicted transcriptional regulator